MIAPCLIPGRAVAWAWPDGPFAGRHVGVYLGGAIGPDGLTWLEIREASSGMIFGVAPQFLAAIE